MKIKLDENLDRRLATVFSDQGYAADTVLDENLTGAPDQAIYDACVANGQTLITLDLDFANPRRFPPGPEIGIVVLRPKRPLPKLIRRMLLQIFPALVAGGASGSLWIVEQGRIRVYDPH